MYASKIKCKNLQTFGEREWLFWFFLLLCSALAVVFLYFRFLWDLTLCLALLCSRRRRRDIDINQTGCLVEKGESKPTTLQLFHFYFISQTRNVQDALQSFYWIRVGFSFFCCREIFFVLLSIVVGEGWGLSLFFSCIFLFSRKFFLYRIWGVCGFGFFVTGVAVFEESWSFFRRLICSWVLGVIEHV